MTGLNLENVLTPCHFRSGAGKRTWLPHLREEFGKPYVRHLRKFLRLERKAKDAHESWGDIFPKPEQVFAALEETPLQCVKAVIIGQDPYHNGQADGLAFSMWQPPKGNNSLKRILEAVRATEGMNVDDDVHNLKPWAKEGVLLLNTVLTVREDMAKSHYGHGWEIFTDKIIEIVSTNKQKNKQKVVFFLWGDEAKEKAQMICPRHKVFCARHPSVYGNKDQEKRFVNKVKGDLFKANLFLGEDGVNWSLSKH